MKVIAVVVTYNRCYLLQKNIKALKSQTRPLDSILVINNGSTDGTKEWLDGQTGIEVITQENIGGSGGFWRGMDEAYSLGADYIWCMDDDVHPYKDCLEEMLKAMPHVGGIVAPQRLLDGKTVVCGGECLYFNMNNPLKPLKRNASLSELTNTENGILKVEAIAFEGPLISKTVVEKIGFPEKDLFIFWDDTEYSYRAHRAGFNIVYASSAHLYKEDLTKGQNISKKCSWKYPYMLRNEVYFVRKYSPALPCIFRLSRMFMQYMLGITKHLFHKDGKYKYKDYLVCLRAFRDGINSKLGKY